MGSSNIITRGQLRPHFSGRSPPFLLAALCVGLGILGISYWSLSLQYNQLEEQLKKSLLRKDSIENDLNFIQNQLSLREEEFSRAKQTLQKNEQELSSAQNQLKTKSDDITRLESIKDTNTKCSEDLNQKTNELADALTKLKEIEQKDVSKDVSKDQNQEFNQLKEENKRLEIQLKELQNKVKNEFKNQSISVSENSVPNVGQLPAIESHLNSDKINTNLMKSNENNKLDKTEPENSNGLSVDTLNDKPNEAVIAEPLKQSQSIATDLAEEDRKEEALVEANDVNNNEIAEEIKDPKELEEIKDKSK